MFDKYDKELRKTLRRYKTGKESEEVVMVTLRAIVDLHSREELRNQRVQILEEAGQTVLNASMTLYSEARGGINMAATFAEFLVERYSVNDDA